VYEAGRKNTDTTQFFFHWDYLDETMRKTNPRRAGQVGFYVIGLTSPDLAAEVSLYIDGMFRNSLARP